MYQITRKNRIKETLQLCHADGTVAEEIYVDLNVDVIAGRMNKAYEALGIAQNELTDEPTPQMIEKFGQAVIAVFEVVFGEDGCRRIVAFYENNYTEMLLDLFPFINDEIMPKIREASEERKQQLIEAAKRSKDVAKKNSWFNRQ